MKAQNTAAGSPAEPREAVVYAELLSRAHEEGLKSIQTQLLLTPSDENGHLAIVKAIVEVERGHFEGLGDADPGSVEDFLAPHLIRVAETRAKARALRDAVNVGVVSFEELDGEELPARETDPGSGATPANGSAPLRRRASGNGNGTSKAAPRKGNGQESMTEAQKRFMFRILAEGGIERDQAHEKLKAFFQVRSLKDVSKQEASQGIERLLEEAKGGGQRS